MKVVVTHHGRAGIIGVICAGAGLRQPCGGVFRVKRSNNVGGAEASASGRCPLLAAGVDDAPCEKVDVPLRVGIGAGPRGSQRSFMRDNSCLPAT